MCLWELFFFFFRPFEAVSAERRSFLQLSAVPQTLHPPSVVLASEPFLAGYEALFNVHVCSSYECLLRSAVSVWHGAVLKVPP